MSGKILALEADELEKRTAWEKGRAIKWEDPNIYRMDDDGRWMRYADHQDRLSHFGWEIDRIEPPIIGGRVHADLRPRHWLSSAKAVHVELRSTIASSDAIVSSPSANSTTSSMPSAPSKASHSDASKKTRSKGLLGRARATITPKRKRAG